MLSRALIAVFSSVFFFASLTLAYAKPKDLITPFGVVIPIPLEEKLKPICHIYHPEASVWIQIKKSGEISSGYLEEVIPTLSAKELKAEIVKRWEVKKIKNGFIKKK